MLPKFCVCLFIYVNWIFFIFNLSIFLLLQEEYDLYLPRKINEPSFLNDSMVDSRISDVYHSSLVVCDINAT
jgi:hypothetical protein